MMCLSPINIPRPNGQGATDRITVPCSKCAACLNKKRQEWAYRLEQELKQSSTAYFVTLTYDDENITINDAGFPVVSKRDVQLFFKRLRKRASFRYFLTAEYGPNTFRPHYHAVIFNLSVSSDVGQIIIEAWQKGHVHIGNVTPASINYVAKYCVTKPMEIKNRDPVFSLMSKKPGIGYAYIEKYKKWHNLNKSRFYALKEDGIKVPLPRYYKTKIYSPYVIKKRTEEMDIDYNPVDPVTFKINNPGQNYYKYLIDYKQDYSRRLKETINKTSKL